MSQLVANGAERNLQYKLRPKLLKSIVLQRDTPTEETAIVQRRLTRTDVAFRLLQQKQERLPFLWLAYLESYEQKRTSSQAECSMSSTKQAQADSPAPTTAVDGDTTEDFDAFTEEFIPIAPTQSNYSTMDSGEANDTTSSSDDNANDAMSFIDGSDDTERTVETKGMNPDFFDLDWPKFEPNIEDWIGDVYSGPRKIIVI